MERIFDWLIALVGLKLLDLSEVQLLNQGHI